MKQRTILFTLLVLSTILFLSCTGPQKSTALVIVLGRHANANAFHYDSYDIVEKYVENAIQGGYIGIITSEGTPKVRERFDEFDTRKIKKGQIKNNTQIILESLKDEALRAETPENNLLKAIQESKALLDIFEEKAVREGRQLGKKQIIIMDTGVVTAGDLDFIVHGLNKFDFTLTNDKIVEFANSVANRLKSGKLLPDLTGTEVIFTGFGDVAMPQVELSPFVSEGLKVFWNTILTQCNADNITITRVGSTKKANTRDAGFKPVKPIIFLGQGGYEIPDEIVTFDFGRWVYKNPTLAKDNLKSFAETMIRSLNKNPSMKIYIVGAESKDQDRKYTTDLSEKRANTVMNTLVELGVPEDKMEGFGLAVYMPRRENDRPGGKFDPEIGKLNQKVMLIPDDIADQEFLQEVLTARNKLN